MSFARKVRRSKWIPALAGIFLFSLILYLSLSVALPTSRSPIKLYSSQQRNDLNRTLVQAVKQARQTITLKTYALTDRSLLSLLKKRAREGLSVHLYYDEKASPKLTHLEEERFHLYPQKGKGLFHEKIWIFDEETVFLGSTNLTPSSLRMHDNMMIGLYAPELAQELSRGRPDTFLREGLQYFSLPHPEALSVLIETLRGAKREIKLTLFTFTHPALAEVLSELHHKGIKIALTLDGTTARGASLKVKEFLEMEGVPVRASRGLELSHTKWGIIDGHTHLIGSANWTKAAFQKNKDFLLIINIK